MPQTAHHERQFIASEAMRDVVVGMADGLTVPLARAVSDGAVERGIALCGSGVGAAVVANKVHGIRACLITGPYSAHQGVEHDDMNIICLGGLVVGHALAWELIQAFLPVRFTGENRHQRRLSKISTLETPGTAA